MDQYDVDERLDTEITEINSETKEALGEAITWK